MVDIRPLGVPVAPKNNTVPIKNEVPPIVIQNVADPSKINKTDPKDFSDHGGLQGQLLLQKDFFNLIKEPGLAAESLRKLLYSYLFKMSVGKTTDVDMQAFGKLYTSFSVDHQGLMKELSNQSEGISMFKGDFFDTLREILTKNLDALFQVSSGPTDALTSSARKNPPMPYNKKLTDAIVNLLKSISFYTTGKDVLSSLKSNAIGLANLLPENSQIGVEANRLVQLLSKAENLYDEQGYEWESVYTQIKTDISTMINSLSTSVFNTTRSDNLGALLLYNLSFLDNSERNLDTDFFKLLSMINDPATKEVLMAQYKGLLSSNILSHLQNKSQSSGLIDTLTKFIMEHSKSSEVSSFGNNEVNNVLRSLIAAPNSFTPLQHYILPLKYGNTHGFAELWVDPYELKKNEKGKIERATHLFFAVDVQPTGFFEVDIVLINSKVNLSIFSPPDYMEAIKAIKPTILNVLKDTEFTFENYSVHKMLKPKELTQVFEKINKKRSGFSVKI